jgi:adenine-specific DNA-methyltransferase
MVFNIENRRYTGSKAKLSIWILDLITRNCEGEIFADIFSGTGIIAATALQFYNHIILNDHLFSNNIIYQAFFTNKQWNKIKINKIINEYNRIKPGQIDKNYFSENFGDKYFSNNNAKIIGFIRDDIEKKKAKLNQKEYHILLASLIYSVDKIANTVGHYDAYIKKPIKDITFKLSNINPFKGREVEIYREDTNLLARKIFADIVYIDPPYNSRQYSRFYHLLETLIKWEKAKLYGVALKPIPENTSEYCKTNASSFFADLIENLNCKYIAVSYNNTYSPKSNSSKNKITLEEIKNILDLKGPTKVYEKKHKYFNAGKTDFNDHKELLFITKTK